ncbi:MmgE/PrpD family protein [Parerythrobacter lacustris]|uniref:MmgE/PrpD family protein n=1 Tax=Parerythrobacter lacustris TaxID=2969984 RepID=A0ABT1XPB8_9SPHN|nr:MmgE/PrpD family protein [Parerythrobacter lacustris]MCR2833511.1 MmgE/PrpD family protein [Parerythrobacter lacustris]
MPDVDGFSRRAMLSGSATLVAGAAIATGSTAIAQRDTGNGNANGESAAEPGAEWHPVMPALTKYIASATSHRVPGDIRERARLHILDTLASIIACQSLEAARLGRQYAVAMGGAGESPILASQQTATAIDAVFASAMTAHAAEINDFIPSAYVQPGPAIVSAAMETARSQRRSGSDLIGAIIVGYEIAGRLPKAIGTRNLYMAGLANHGVAPTFGTAAAVAPLLGLESNQVNHMLAYCAQMASGSWQWLLDVRHIEKAFVFAGMGARNGMQAAHMARLGFTGVPDSFDNENGWFRWRAFQGEGKNHASLVEGLNERWELSLAAMKRYPVGGPTQPAVRALLDLRQTVRPDQVESILVAMPGEAATFERANMPALNIPYLAAIIMLDGRLDFVDAQSLDRQANDTNAAAFARRVTVVRDAAQEMGEGEDRTESARVTIVLKNGTSKERYVPYVPGFPTHPLSKSEVEEKARELVVPVLGAEKASRLIALCDSLDAAANIDPLVDLMRFGDG